MNKRRMLYRVMEFPFVTLFFLIIAIGFFRFVAPYMFTSHMMVFNLSRQIAIIMPIVIGQAIVMLSGHFDLSVSVIALVSSFTFVSLSEHSNVWVALTVAFVLALVIGGINGLLAAFANKVHPGTKSKVALFFIRRYPSLVITFISMSVILWIFGKFQGWWMFISLSGPGEAAMFESYVNFGVVFWIPIIIVIALCIYHLLSNNAKKVNSLGLVKDIEIVTKKERFTITVGVYVISAFLASLTGFLMTLRVRAYIPMIFSSYEWYSVAIAVIGGICILGGRGKLIGVLFGVTLWNVLTNGFLIMGISIYARNVFVWCIMFVLIALNVLQSVLFRRMEAKELEKELERDEQI